MNLLKLIVRLFRTVSSCIKGSVHEVNPYDSIYTHMQDKREEDKKDPHRCKAQAFLSTGLTKYTLRYIYYSALEGFTVSAKTTFYTH